MEISWAGKNFTLVHGVADKGEGEAVGVSDGHGLGVI